MPDEPRDRAHEEHRTATLAYVMPTLIGVLVAYALSLVTTGWMAARGWVSASPDGAIVHGLLPLAASRALFTLLAGRLAAQMAPSRPMLHATLVGVVLTLLAVFGAGQMTGAAPTGYIATIIGLALPSAWLGGALALRSAAHRAHGA